MLSVTNLKTPHLSFLSSNMKSKQGIPHLIPHDGSQANCRWTTTTQPFFQLLKFPSPLKIAPSWRAPKMGITPPLVPRNILCHKKCPHPAELNSVNIYTAISQVSEKKTQSQE